MTGRSVDYGSHVSIVVDLENLERCYPSTVMLLCRWPATRKISDSDVIVTFAMLTSSSETITAEINSSSQSFRELT
jgi:hypothetical protein